MAIPDVPAIAACQELQGRKARSRIDRPQVSRYRIGPEPLASDVEADPKLADRVLRLRAAAAACAFRGLISLREVEDLSEAAPRRRLEVEALRYRLVDTVHQALQRRRHRFLGCDCDVNGGGPTRVSLDDADDADRNDLASEPIAGLDHLAGQFHLEGSVCPRRRMGRDHLEDTVAWNADGMIDDTH
jgi:hypothetical protein